MKINIIALAILLLSLMGYSCNKGGTGTTVIPSKVKTITMELKSNSSYLKNINTYNYDASGRISSVSFSPGNTVNFYTYNSNNYFIDQKDSTGKTLTHSEYYLNSNQMIDSQRTTYSPGESYYDIFHYDMNNNLLEDKYYSDIPTNNECVSTFYYTYVNGNPVKRISINLVTHAPLVYDTFTRSYTYYTTSSAALPIINSGKSVTYNNIPKSLIVSYSTTSRIDSSFYTYTFNNNNMVATSTETNNKSGGQTITYTYTYY